MYNLYVRHDYGERVEDTSLGLFTTVEKCVEWIKQHGLGWEDRDSLRKIDYQFVILSFVVDFEEEQQPLDEIYICDKEGKTPLSICKIKGGDN